jgi:hypothetical protein
MVSLLDSPIRETRMRNISLARWRKTSDFQREHAIFELICQDEILLSVAFSDAGRLEILFENGIPGTLANWDDLLQILNEGRKLAEEDR